jgi:hypothetical protein
MDIRWIWAFLDLPEERADGEVKFWRAVTRSELSPWRGDRSEFATLLPAEGDPWVKVQRVGGAGGVHVDLEVGVPLPEAAERAVRLGAQVVSELDDVVVCRSPGGFAFCLTAWDPASTSHGGQVRRGAQSLLDQVCLDMPQNRYAAEVTFWSALTGWAVDPNGAEDEFERLAWPAGLPVRFLLQRLEEQDGQVRAHVDLSAVDRAAEVARHVALGAREVGPGRGWTVLVDPAGMTYCVTDRHPLTGGAPPR